MNELKDGNLTVKQYAEQRGKTSQAVYKQLRGIENAKALEGHIFRERINNRMTTVLDAEAVRVLDEASKQSVQIVEQTNDKEKIEALEQENKMLLLKIAELQDKLIEKQDDIQRLQNEKMELLEAKQKPEPEPEPQKPAEPEKPKGFFARLFGR